MSKEKFLQILNEACETVEFHSGPGDILIVEDKTAAKLDEALKRMFASYNLED